MPVSLRMRPLQPWQPPPKSRRPLHEPCLDLLRGPREDFLNIGFPLYEALINCNWKAAKAILDKNQQLVRYGITENWETPLHVAASVKRNQKRVVEFVRTLVDMMSAEDCEIQNKSCNTALYIAAVAGNVGIVRIIVDKNREVLRIPGSEGHTMPLHAAALFGNKYVVKYIYEESRILSNEDGWDQQTRSWLVETLIKSNMFDTALDILKEHKDLDTSGILGVLAGKPEAFLETKSNIMDTIIKSVCAFISPKRASKQEINALPLLRFIWNDVVKKPKDEIDRILKGPPDSIMGYSETFSRWDVTVLLLEKVIFEHVEKMSGDNIFSGPLTVKSNVLKLQTLVFERIAKMLVETQNIIKGTSNSIMHENKLDSNKEHIAIELEMLIFKHISEMHEKTQKIIRIALKDKLTPKEEYNAKAVISSHIEKLKNETIEKTTMNEIPSYSSRIPFIAAEMGNTKFLVELIRRYPDMIWHLNEKNQSIFHIAVKNRHESIYNLLYEVGIMKDTITPLRDLNHNNMWHLAGMCAKGKHLAHVSGVALHMQLELLWFYEVKRMVPPLWRERVNKDGLTPYELFTKEHKNLVSQGEKWMKGTANQCMVVAALIATIVFAAAFTLPGGYNQTNGIPIFHSKASFAVFVVADAISLISSSSSILLFLSILTSRFVEHDFLESVPRKLLFGLGTLFLSITTMMVAFGVSFFILYQKGLLWMPILICIFVLFPAVLYIWLQYGLFADIIQSMYRSRYMFNNRKNVVYYENPKV